jgi:RNA polymerase sigma factor (sigma-70 family)
MYLYNVNINTSFNQEINNQLAIDKNYQELINNNKYYIRKIARSYSQIKHLDDLIQICNIALIKAADDYNPTRGNFIALAGARIRYACLNYLTEFARIIRLPANVQYNPTYAHLKEKHSKLILSLDYPSENSYNLKDKIEAKIEDNTSISTEMITAIQSLKQDKQDIIKLYFGLDDEWNEVKPLTLREIAIKFNVTHQRIGQIKDQALEIIKKQLINQMSE